MTDERQGLVRVPEHELEAYRQQQLHEYGTYVAAQDIYAGLALAYREGDPVPVSNVELHGYDKNGMVRKVAEEAPSEPVNEADEPVEVISEEVDGNA